MTNFLEQETSPRVTNAFSTILALVLLPLLILGVFNSITWLLRAFGTPAHIVVNTDIRLETVNTNFMHAYAQGGEEAKDMLAPVVAQVRSLRPRLIRIDHIYDHFDVVSVQGDNLSFNWTKLDLYVNSILATGATPVFSLSYMPAAIAKDGNIINPPNNWNDWSLVVQKTVEHFSGRLERNLANVYYEVWNEPDLAQFGGWRLSGDKNYITMYRYAQQGAERAAQAQPFFLGGPATTGLYKNWILALVQNGLRVDFWSWHSYLADPFRFAQDQRNLAGWLAPTPRYALTQKFVTEFGFTGAKDERYNTMFAAAHTAAVFRAVSSGGPTYLFSFELKDGPNQENGWGLLTHESAGARPKPRYHVYNFLDAMAGQRIELSGEGTWVRSLATERDGILRVLLVNFNHQSSKSENVPVTFNRLTPGTYTIRERFLMGRDTTFTQTVIADAPLTREVYMPANSVAVLEISPAQQETTPGQISQ